MSVLYADALTEIIVSALRDPSSRLRLAEVAADKWAAVEVAETLVPLVSDWIELAGSLIGNSDPATVQILSEAALEDRCLYDETVSISRD